MQLEVVELRRSRLAVRPKQNVDLNPDSDNYQAQALEQVIKHSSPQFSHT